MTESKIEGFRVHPDDEDDAAIIAWLDTQRNKSRAIKAVLLRHVNKTPEANINWIRIILALVDKLQTAGMPTEQIMEGTELDDEFLTNLENISRQSETFED